MKKAGGWWDGIFFPGALPDPDSGPVIDLQLLLWGSSPCKGPEPLLCASMPAHILERTFPPLASECDLPVTGCHIPQTHHLFPTQCLYLYLSSPLNTFFQLCQGNGCLPFR